MNLKAFLKATFGKDLFSHLDKDEVLEERIKTEKKIERISDEINAIQTKIQKLMISSKGQPRPMKLLNAQKIKAYRLESNTKQQEAETYIKQLQVLLLVEAMREQQETREKSEFIEKILESDIDHLTEVLFDKDVKKAVEEGKIDDVKEKLKSTFAKETIPSDKETEEILGAIDDLEKVDEETAVKIAEEKSKKMVEAPKKKQEDMEEE